MAKRKTKRPAEDQHNGENEEMPDAPPQGTKRTNDEDSDEVRIAYIPNTQFNPAN
jgi:hypothetical protein